MGDVFFPAAIQENHVMFESEVGTVAVFLRILHTLW